MDFEYLVKDVRGKLAYTVALERAEVLYPGRTEPSEHFLRATMIFRYEKGAWKIVHRHADNDGRPAAPGVVGRRARLTRKAMIMWWPFPPHSPA